MTTHDETQSSLLRATQHLQAAADIAEADTLADPSRYVTELGVLSLLWLCQSLLPHGLNIGASSRGDHGVGELLRAADSELRSYPMARYPVGTLTVVVGLGDLIRQTSASGT